MIKELLSDFYKVINPSYQPDTFSPYFSVILTIVTFTILVYSFQIFTTTVHAYAANPVSIQSEVVKTQNCRVFVEFSIRHLCRGLTNNHSPYISAPSLSLEQDIQSSMK